MQELSCIELVADDLLGFCLKNMGIRIDAAEVVEIEYPWEFCASDGLSCFYAVVAGRCILTVNDTGEKLPLEGGDMALILQPQQKAYAFTCDHPSLSRTSSAHRPAFKGTFAPYAILIRGTFSWKELELTAQLPGKPIILPVGEDKSALSWMTETAKMMAEEAASHKPGAQSLINDLATILFVERIESHATASDFDNAAVIERVSNKQIRLALYQIHTHLDEPWSLASLARCCGMSRSAFAVEFKRALDVTPMAYLLEVRMHRACYLLGKERLKIKDVAKHTGYKSQPAFCNAFRRWTGIAPGVWQKEHSGLKSDPNSIQ